MKILKLKYEKSYNCELEIQLHPFEVVNRRKNNTNSLSNRLPIIFWCTYSHSFTDFLL